MDDETAVLHLGALGQTTRLKLFRRLVRAGPAGLAAGALARDCALQPSALSFHISHLQRAGLVARRRLGRQVFYAVAIEEMRRLIVHLTQDCCDGHPEVCAGLTQAIAHGSNGEAPRDASAA